jgi:hypothetical protein
VSLRVVFRHQPKNGLRCRRVAASATRDRGRSSRIESTTSPSPTAAGQHRCPLTFGLWTKEASLSEEFVVAEVIGVATQDVVRRMAARYQPTPPLPSASDLSNLDSRSN